MSPALPKLVAPPLAENKLLDPALPHAMTSGTESETQDTTAKPRANFIMCSEKLHSKEADTSEDEAVPYQE
jgi:hypothetical protein